MKFKSTSLIIAAALLSFVSCGNNKKNHPPVSQAQEVTEPGIERGIYRANLRSINPKILSALNGTTLIKVRGNEFLAETLLTGATSNTVIRQYISKGATCPTQASDVNGDGYIDAVEGSSNYGGAFISLDGDVGSMTRGEEVFPHTNRKGEFKYSEFSLLSYLMDELKVSLGLTNKTVVLFGVSSTTDLPDSVSSTEEYSPQASLPIACGEIIKIGEEFSSAGKVTL